MSFQIRDIDDSVNKSVCEFFRKKDTQKRPNLQPVCLSDPQSKAELMKIMDRVGAKNLLTFCAKIARHAK